MRLVLDTNVVIDWLVFDHPYMSPLRAAVLSQAVRVLTHEFSLAEFARVLRYPPLKLAESRCEELERRYREQTRAIEMPTAFAVGAWQLPERFPKCRDRDDDLFLALAFHSRADALVTRDKALLKMRKRVRRFDLAIWDVRELIERLARPAAEGSTAG